MPAYMYMYEHVCVYAYKHVHKPPLAIPAD